MRIVSGIMVSFFLFGMVSPCASPEPAEESTEASFFPLDAGEVPLETIVVTNRRTPSRLEEATEDVIVLDEQDIASLPAQDPGEVLRYVPGVDIQPNRGFSHGSAVTLQGCDSRHVLLMLDGIPLNNQASGQADLARFPLENIDHIEVIRGPSSSTWGSALGGVINLITKDTGTTTKPQGSLTTSFAEFGTRRHSAEVSGRGGLLGYYLSSSYMESGGRDLRDDVLQRNVFGKISYESDPETRFTASFGYSDAATHSGISLDGTWQAQPYRVRYGKVGWQKDHGRWRSETEVKYANQNIGMRAFLTATDTSPLVTVRTDDLLYQLSTSSATTVRSEDVFVWGADVEWHRLTSTYLSEEKTLTFGAPYVHYTLVQAPWNLHAGLRFDYNSEYGREWSPSVGALYRFEHIPETFLRFGVSRAFSAPPLLWKHFDLVLSGRTTNPDIHAERAWVYMVGAQSRPLPALRLDLSLYRADVSEAITLAVDGSGDYYMKNFEKFTRQGAQLQAHVEVTPELRLSLAAAFNEVEDKATGQTVMGGGKPRESYSVTMDYRGRNGFRLCVLGYYDWWNEPPSSRPNDRKMLVDIKVSQELKNMIFFLAVHNVTNSKYWADYYFPIPERYFEGGFTFKW